MAFMTTADDLVNRFSFHPADERKREIHDRIRDLHLQTALVMSEIVPPGRELSSCLTRLEESMFWANAGVARKGSDGTNP